MMPEMILYLLKVNIALLLFYAGYRFILQRYTFHTLNRFYLLVGLIYSALYPLIDLSNILNRNPHLKEQIGLLAPDWQGSVTYVISRAENGSGNYWQIVLLIFWTGVIFMSLRLLIQLISLLILHIQSSSFTIENFKFRKITKAVNPFSFWRTIYLNPECHEESELRSILEHEHVHVKQLHTFDVMLAELSTIFYWFNPGVWLIKKAIKANLEFITDQEVIRSGVDSREYQYALLKTQVLPQNSMPVNNFHFLTIKKRIAMINKKPSSRINIGGYLFLLPAIMLLVLITGISKAEFPESTVAEVIGRIPQISKLPEMLKREIGSLKTSESDTDQAARLNAALEKTRANQKNLGSDTSKKTSRIGIATRQNNTPGIILRSINKTDTTADSQPLYIIDGVRSGTKIPHLVPDSIVTINVSKGDRATSLYGIEAKNGVIEITTKSNIALRTSGGTAPVTVRGYYDPSSTQKISLGDIDKELIFLDGKEITKTELDQIKVSSIGTIDIYKGSSAEAKYGEKAKRGVVVITTKKN